MAIKASQSEERYSNPSVHTTADSSREVCRHTRTNPVTGETDYYFPLEITDPSIRTLAKAQELEICRARLGFRVFEAVMVPCKNIATVHGLEIFIDTPSDVQRQRYMHFIENELAAQDVSRQNSRCIIPNGHGSTRRCPRRIPNPDYVPGGDKPKTVPIPCEGCKYELFRQSHAVIELSCLDHEGNDTLWF